MDANNLVAVFESTVQRCQARPCFRYVENGTWQTLNWLEVRSKVTRLSGGLRRFGIKLGDRVCILSKTRCEWTIADLAIMASGAVVVPIYESSTPDQICYIIENSGAKVIFVENESQYKKVLSVQKKLPELRQIICFDELSSKKPIEGVYSLDEAMMLGGDAGEKVYRESIDLLKPENEASFVYTSGTTGDPKGAVLTHKNFLAALDSAAEVLHFDVDTESLIFLPLAHILARMVQFIQLSDGFVHCYAESIDRLLANITEVRPHFIASVPRIFEKIHSRVLQDVAASSPMKKNIFHWALGVGRERSRYLLNQQRVPILIAAQYELAHRLVFSKLHKKLGGRMKFFISGGAPLSAEVGAFFHAFGFEILEGYGLTETTALVSINRPGATKMGTVGKPFSGMALKIAADGEILTKGGAVFSGYYKNPESTAEAIDAESWFHTGDIGELDAEGFLRITDRKKDIIVTAAGKNIAPQNIENLIKTDPYISQIVIHGDRRKFLSALVTLEKPEIEKFAKLHHIPFDKYDELVANEKVFDFIRTRIDEKNKQLAKYETIKRFAILPDDFSVESGELTPTLKIKRKVIAQKYRSIFDNFYAE